MKRIELGTMMDGGDLEADREEWRRAFNDLSTYRIPFGKYKDSLLVDLPEEYLMWFRERGFPQGRLGELMQLVMEIKITGAEEVLAPLRRRRPK